MESWPGLTYDAASDTIFVSYSTEVYQLNPATGAELWRYPKEPNSKTQFYAPPVVAENGDVLIGGYDHVFYSLKPGSDQPNWTFNGAKDRFIAGALVANDLVYAPSADNHLYALNLADGSKRWEFVSDHALWATPVVVGDLLYLAATDHHVYALNPLNGELVWETDDLGGQMVAPPRISVDGSMLYVSTFGSKTDDPERTSQLIALDAKTGAEVWKLPISGWVWATPLLEDGTLYFGDTVGFFYRVDSAQGSLRWKYPQSGAPKPKTGILGAPVALNGTMYFGNEAGALVTLDGATGNPLGEKNPWEAGKTTQIFASLLAVNDMILIAPMNYESALLIAVDADGNLRWTFLPVKE